jgi:GNAT superfamily N-acetyltransferase
VRVTHTVRPATADDVLQIREVAVAAWRDTYAGLLRSETIEAFVASAYAIERLRLRIGRDVFLVAEQDGRIVAFADARARTDAVDLFAIYARPDARGLGAGTALLDALRERFPGLPIVADVLAGNRKGEVFYERRGFERGERVDEQILGEPVVERRWRLPSEADA